VLFVRLVVLLRANCRWKAPPLASLLGAVIGSLVGGLYDAQHVYISMRGFQRASRGPVAPVGLAVLVSLVMALLIK
jgi:hypothetical protein